MSIEVTVIVLLAAALHAGWNTLIKISGDRVCVMAFVTLAGSLISLLFLPFVESPDPSSWPLLALTIWMGYGCSRTRSMRVEMLILVPAVFFALAIRSISGLDAPPAVIAAWSGGMFRSRGFGP